LLSIGCSKSHLALLSIQHSFVLICLSHGLERSLDSTHTSWRQDLSLIGYNLPWILHVYLIELLRIPKWLLSNCVILYGSTCLIRCASYTIILVNILQYLLFTLSMVAAVPRLADLDALLPLSCGFSLAELFLAPVVKFEAY
jgi:hypothetical protein